jgi:hypothetical protein
MVPVLVLAGSPVHAQSHVPPEQDNHAFRLVLNQFGLQPLLGMNDLSDPAKTIVIVFGNTGPLANIPNGLNRFLQNGGAVLIATDFGLRNILRRDFGLSLTGTQLRAADGGETFGDSSECPLVRPAKPAGVELFDTTRPIATNRPSYLNNAGRLPDLAWIVGRPDGRRSPGTFRFAVGGDVGIGRLLVIADHSIFINGMMIPRDLENGNMQFAFNCVKWLSQDGRRDRVLFIDEGTVVKNFDVPLQTLPDLPLGPVELANVVIAAAENENLFNRFILEQFGRSRVLRGWLIGLTVALLLYGLYRLIRGGYQPDPHVLPVVSCMSPNGRARAVVDQRREEQIAAGNYAEAARDLARAALADLGYDPIGPATADSLSMRIDAHWPVRGALAKRVRFLWSIAYGTRDRRHSHRQLARLRRYMSDLRGVADDGRLALTAIADGRTARTERTHI